jgi:hypothetical protein
MEAILKDVNDAMGMDDAEFAALLLKTHVSLNVVALLIGWRALINIHGVADVECNSAQWHWVLEEFSKIGVTVNSQFAPVAGDMLLELV